MNLPKLIDLNLKLSCVNYTSIQWTIKCQKIKTLFSTSEFIQEWGKCIGHSTVQLCQILKRYQVKKHLY